MVDSLYNGISGLDSFQKSLNTESNNISNINTVAYKSDVISFADMMYQNSYGKGTAIVNIDKNFAQGSLKITGNVYDMAIEGDGFFTVNDQKINETFYTRAGNFNMGVDGVLKMPSGHHVMGLSIDAPEVISTNPAVTRYGASHTNFLATQNISSPTVLTSINAVATDYTKTSTTSGDSGTNYKTASSKIRDVDALANEYRSILSSYSLNTVDGTTSVAQTSTALFGTDTIDDGDFLQIYIDGNKYKQSFDTNREITLKKFSDQISTIDGFTSKVDTATGELEIESLIPGKSITVSGAMHNAQGININTTDAIKGSGLAAVESVRTALKTAVEAASGEFLELKNSVNLEDQDTLTLSPIQLQLSQLDVSDNSFGTFSVIDGALYMKQDDNQFLVGKLVVSMFKDIKGLDPQGENLYEKTDMSGDPLFIKQSGSIKNEMLENSNSDLSEGLVRMMTLQRSFEASSKSVTTSDELLKTAIQLKN